METAGGARCGLDVAVADEFDPAGGAFVEEHPDDISIRARVGGRRQREVGPPAGERERHEELIREMEAVEEHVLALLDDYQA